MTTLLLTVALLGVCFALLALRIVAIKGGTFRGGSCGKDPNSGDCGFCSNVDTCPETPKRHREPKR